MAKLRTDITYKYHKQESILLKSAIDNIKPEQNMNLLNNLDEQNKKNDPDNDDRNNLDYEVEESDEDTDEEFNIEMQFQNQIDQSLEIDDIDNNDNFEIDDIDVEGVEHPVQNKD